MSKIKVQQPIQHIPSFKKWAQRRSDLVRKLRLIGVKPLCTDQPMDSWIYFTDLEGWGKILWDLVFSSKLYKRDIFNCDKYALKAYITCCERYGLNSLLLAIGDMPQGRHGFNIFPYYDSGDVGFMLWEPNDGFQFSGSAFEVGEYKYFPESALI